MKILLEFPGPIPLRFFIKSLLKVNGNALGTCWANDLPASQPTNQSTSQPPAGLAGLGWAGWAVWAGWAELGWLWLGHVTDIFKIAKKF